MGLSFKPNIDDLRESPAKYIVQEVLQDAHDDEFYIVEPNLGTHQVFKLTSTEKAIEKADIIVFLVAHDEFRDLEIPKDKNVLDFSGVRE
jgi:UDP-N-acetyl-D-mannosaminuronic acid dehydrogenase